MPRPLADTARRTFDMNMLNSEARPGSPDSVTRPAGNGAEVGHDSATGSLSELIASESSRTRLLGNSSPDIASKSCQP